MTAEIIRLAPSHEKNVRRVVDALIIEYNNPHALHYDHNYVSSCSIAVMRRNKLFPSLSTITAGGMTELTTRGEDTLKKLLGADYFKNVAFVDGDSPIYGKHSAGGKPQLLAVIELIVLRYGFNDYALYSSTPIEIARAINKANEERKAAAAITAKATEKATAINTHVKNLEAFVAAAKTLGEGYSGLETYITQAESELKILKRFA